MLKNKMNTVICNCIVEKGRLILQEKRDGSHWRGGTDHTGEKKLILQERRN
jgi:hypothetical protein